MLREAIVNKKSSILVLPYVAIVQEKVWTAQRIHPFPLVAICSYMLQIASLSVFEEAFGIRIEEYAANKGKRCYIYWDDAKLAFPS